MLEIVILAAGKGTRMRSGKPKVLHTLAGKPFLGHVIQRSQELIANKIHLVVGHGAETVKSHFSDENLYYVEQREQLGTGHAVQQVLPKISAGATVLILYGDVPLISTPTLRQLLSKVSDNAMGLLTVSLDEPHGYGRIIRGANGQVASVVEQKDASSEQQKVKEVNTGVMAVRGAHLLEWLPKLSNDNVQGEYLLPDIIAMACAQGIAVETAQPADAAEVMGVNDRRQQAELERLFQARVADDLMSQGVTLMDPSRFDCRGELTVGADCVIDVNCVFEGKVSLGNNVVIGPNCHISDSHIGDNTEIFSHTVLEQANVGASAAIGPFARLRPLANLADGTKVGNFVEIKKAQIGLGSKVNHLSYIGDAEVGAGVNVGAGTITCNYDGANKHLTKIEDGVFVGSNSALVAPVTLGKDSTIAAGSTITANVGEARLAITRTPQRSIEGWLRPTKKKPKA